MESQNDFVEKQSIKKEPPTIKTEIVDSELSEVVV